MTTFLYFVLGAIFGSARGVLSRAIGGLIINNFLITKKKRRPKASFFQHQAKFLSSAERGFCLVGEHSEGRLVEDGEIG
jgi:hypothetical protein